MFDMYRNGIGNIEISDKNLREEISDRIAAGNCTITGHEPANDDERGWDEFELELSDGRTVAGTYGWDEEGYRSLRVVEDGERLRMYGVGTQRELEEKLRAGLSEEGKKRVAAIQNFNEHADSEEALIDFVAGLIGDRDEGAIIDVLIMAGWTVPNAIGLFREWGSYEYLVALYSEDEGEEV